MSVAQEPSSHGIIRGVVVVGAERVFEVSGVAAEGRRANMIRHEDDGRKTYTICPLALAEVGRSNSLMIVNCHYVMAPKQKGKVRFDVEPDAVSFHLLEAAGRPR